MATSPTAFGIMASSLGVVRYTGESDDSFFMRGSYSASRFWTASFCMDDGAQGREGIAKQALNRRLKAWISQIDTICPGANAWFDANGKGIPSIYNRLIDIGELARLGFGNTYVATAPRILGATSTTSLLVGFFDPTNIEITHSNVSVNEIVTSGLASILPEASGEDPKEELWWESDIELRKWEPLSDFEGVQFANPRAPRWKVSAADVWTDAPDCDQRLGLARIDGKAGDDKYFVMRRSRGRSWLSPIEWIEAETLFFFMRRQAGNPVVASCRQLDNAHALLTLPIGFVPGRINRFLEATSWPIKDSVERNHRIFRREALPMVKTMLQASHVSLKEV